MKKQEPQIRRTLGLWFFVIAKRRMDIRRLLISVTIRREDCNAVRMVPVETTDM